MKFSYPVCTASYPIIHRGDNFYIWSRKEAKYQMCPWRLTGNDNVLRKKSTLPLVRKIWGYLQKYLSIFRVHELYSNWKI